jgi:hypothetical protein
MNVNIFSVMNMTGKISGQYISVRHFQTKFQPRYGRDSMTIGPPSRGITESSLRKSHAEIVMES